MHILSKSNQSESKVLKKKNELKVDFCLNMALPGFIWCIVDQGLHKDNQQNICKTSVNICFLDLLNVVEPSRLAVISPKDDQKKHRMR